MQRSAVPTLLVLALATLPALAQGAEEGRASMEHPVPLIANGDFSAPLDGNWDIDGGPRNQAEVVAAEAGGFTAALRCRLEPEPNASPWSLAVGQRGIAPIEAGDVVYFRAWLRSPERCPVTFILEQASGDYRKYISEMARPGPEWVEYRFAARVTDRFDAGAAQAKFFLGHAKGTVEIAGVRVENYGPAELTAFAQTIDYWGGREHSDAWREEALARIERLRKGELRVTVVGEDGQPVAGAQVHVAMQRHFFRFGTAAPAFRFVDRSDPNNVRFQEEVARLFNTVTYENDLKWASIGDGSLSTVLQATEWCRARGIEVRGHCLLWGSYQHLPPSARSLRGGELWAACESHIRDYASRMAGKVYLWDVVNEAATNTELWDEVGWERFPESFRIAQEADPDARLCYNDYGIVHDNSPAQRENAARRVEQLLDAGAPVTTLGLQSHCGLPLTPIDRVLANMDRWAAFGRGLEVTEYDLSCWDDATHAAWTRDFLTATFSHPAMEAFIMWGFWEGSHWLGDKGGAMFRQDWSRRPTVDAYEDLVFHQWWTDWRGETGADGTASTRAFFGTHTVTVSTPDGVREVTVELTPETPGAVRVEL